MDGTLGIVGAPGGRTGHRPGGVVEISLTGNRLTVSGRREEEHHEDDDRFYA